MIDFKFFDEFLSKKEGGFIDNNDKITLEVIDYLKKWKQPQWNKLFIKTGNNNHNPYLYQVEVKCKECGKIFEEMISKTKLFEHLQSEKSFECKECKEKEKQKNENKKVEVKNLFLQRTMDYIELYLDPERSWREDIGVYDKMRYISDVSIENETIAEYINTLEYREFLNTPYWKAIAQRVKAKAKYKCELCSSNHMLVTHHKTYERHGYEHLYWREDLICLCKKCHEKFHFD